MSLDLDKHEAIARGAAALAPGPWRADWISEDDHEEGIDSITDSAGGNVVCADSGVYEPRGQVAEHIAANDPATVIELIEEIRRLRKQIETRYQDGRL